jgi:hypothetical protein
VESFGFGESRPGRCQMPAPTHGAGREANNLQTKVSARGLFDQADVARPRALL